MHRRMYSQSDYQYFPQRNLAKPDYKGGSDFLSCDMQIRFQMAADLHGRSLASGERKENRNWGKKEGLSSKNPGIHILIRH